VNKKNKYGFVVIVPLLVWALIVLPYNIINAQTTQTEFGKNKVQYTPLVWQYYESSNFNVYFSTGGIELARFVVTAAEKDWTTISGLLSYTVTAKIEIIVFGDISDYNQSNIGYEPTAGVFNSGGNSKVIGNRIFVYFNGDHQALNQQIKKGIAKISLDYMLYGSTLAEIVQNAVLLNLPDWFTSGLVSYIALPWDAYLDEQLKDQFANEKVKSFASFLITNEALAAHSFWNYIFEKYDVSTISNLLYITRLNRSLDAGLLYVLGKNYTETAEDWLQYYVDRYEADSKGRKQTISKNKWTAQTKKNEINSIAKVNVAGDYIAYSVKDNGRWALCIQKQNEKPSKLIKKGLRNNILPDDAQNPVFTFDYSGKKLIAFYMLRKKYFQLVYDCASQKSEVTKIAAFRKIVDINYGSDKSTILVTAIKEASSDIYLYNYLTGKTLTITNDVWDDKQPHYVTLAGKKGIAFASNRTNEKLQKPLADTTFPIGNYDIFFYNVNKKNITRVTNTLNATEAYPMQYNAKLISYLSDENGIFNRYVGQLDSIYLKTDTVVFFKDSTITNPRYTSQDSLIHIPNSLIDSIAYVDIYGDIFTTYTLTNYNRSILAQEAPIKSKVNLDSYLDKNKITYFKTTARDSIILKEERPLPTTWRTKQIQSILPSLIADSIQENTPNDKTALQVDNKKQDEYQTPFNMPWDTLTFLKKDSNNLVRKEPIFKANKVVPYLLKTYTNNFNMQIDRNTIMPMYQQFLGYATGYIPELNTMWLKTDIKDVLQDYRLQMGAGLSSSFGGYQAFVRVQNFRNRLDKQYTFFRKTENYNTAESYKIKQKINYAETKLTYPIDEFRSFRGNIGLRNDRLELLSSDIVSLEQKPIVQWIAIAKLEYVHDNTRMPQLNIYKGLRYKAFFEFQQGVNEIKNRTFIIGTDIRHYQSLFKNIIWANRFAYQTSMGTNKMLYFLGGVDSWLYGNNKNENAFTASKVDNSTPIDDKNNYAYQTLATNLRGFKYNVRNGSNFFVWNTELRIPVFTSILNRPVKKEFFKNFQIVGFFDLGSAWAGPSPFSDKAKLSFTDVLWPKDSPIKVEVNYYRNPMVFGTGWGLRSTILGYFVRLDFAKGIDNKNNTNRITYLSLSTDF
jgi:hypothetical protein